MKRTTSIVTVLVFLLLSFANAEVDFDTKQYTIEDLILIRSLVEEEINTRVGSASATLQPGKYVAGVDIAAGSYILDQCKIVGGKS